MVNRIMQREELIPLIEQGRTLVLAASQQELVGLPRGRWIGGIANHCFTHTGPLALQHGIHAIDLTDYTTAPSIQTYHALSLDALYLSIPSAGFSYAILPGYTEMHRLFALYSYSTPSAANAPLFGWVTGAGTGAKTTQENLVMNGYTGEVFADAIIAMHCHLREGLACHLQPFTPMQPDLQTEITFPEFSFMADTILVNGQPASMCDYLEDLHTRGRFSLQADFDQRPQFIVPFTDPTTRMGLLSCPAFPNVSYHESYAEESAAAQCLAFLNAPPLPGEVFSTAVVCSCFYDSFAREEVQTAQVQGMFAHGEICGILRNNHALRLSITAQ